MSKSLFPSNFFLVEELSAIVSALIGGAKYGVKIRLPHAVIMTCLFRKDLSSKEKIRTIVKLVFEHASNLAVFAFIYKIVLATLKFSSRYFLREGQQHQQRRLCPDTMMDKSKSLGRILMALIVNGPLSLTKTISTKTIEVGQPERPYHSLLAGATGGYFVWGRYSSVNHQIILYLTSRILVGLAKRGWELIFQKPSHSPSSIFQHTKTYPMMAATVWGIVMLLFEESPHVLHRSLKASMDEIYRRPV
mmetsp:Transcript_26215/g.26644  ORF Transcript_26215/g.26644 Transcript_26215/m.26644 type:complete len:248 (-) Transcript_26215:440-1183(-)